jgi:biopolymer transport protein ExbD
MANKIRKRIKEADELDLTIFMALMVCLIPVLLSMAEFARMATVDISLPRGRGSQTESTQSEQPQEEPNKLILTVLLSDSAITVGARDGFVLPSIIYKEFHDYRSRIDGFELRDVEFNPKLLDRRTGQYGAMPTHPLFGEPFAKQDRTEIRLVAYNVDDSEAMNFTTPVMGYYSIPRRDAAGRVIHDGNDLLVLENGMIIESLEVGMQVYALTTQFSTTVLGVRDASEEGATEIPNRRLITVENLADYEKRPVSAYDLLKSLLVQIRERFPDVEDRDDVIIAADDHIIYDKIIQVMDIARSANLVNISIARFREQG